MIQAHSLVHRLPDDLLGILWSSLDSDSRKALFHTCHYVHSAPSIHCQLGTKLILPLVGEDENPWQIRGGFGGQTLKSKPPLLRHPPGARLHTLRVKGCGDYFDGPRMLHIFKLSSYAEGEDRSRAAELLRGLEVLEVEMCNLDACFSSMSRVLEASCPNLTTLRVLEMTKVSMGALTGTELLERIRDIKQQWVGERLTEAVSWDGTVTAEEAKDRLEEEFWNANEDDDFLGCLFELDDMMRVHQGRILRNMLHLLCNKGVRELHLKDVLLLYRCFLLSPSPPPPIKHPLLPFVVLLHVGKSTYGRICRILPLACKEMPALKEFTIGTLSEVPESFDQDNDFEDELDIEGIGNDVVKLAALLHPAPNVWRARVKVKVHELMVLESWTEQLPVLLQPLKGKYLMEDVCKLTFMNSFVDGRIKDYSKLMPNIQELQMSVDFYSRAQLLELAAVLSKQCFRKLQKIRFSLERNSFGFRCGEGVLEMVDFQELHSFCCAGQKMLVDLASLPHACARPIKIVIQCMVPRWCYSMHSTSVSRWCKGALCTAETSGMSSSCAQILTQMVLNDWRKHEEHLFGTNDARLRLGLCVQKQDGTVFFSA